MMYQYQNQKVPNLWNRLKAAFSSPSDLVFPTGQQWETWFPRSKYNYKKEVGTGYENSIVMATILWAARNFPGAPIRLYDPDADGNLVYVPKSPFYDLIRKPNDYYSGIALWYATVIEFMATGNAYWLMLPSASGRIVQFWWLPTALVEPKWDKSGNEYIGHYEYKPNPLKMPIRIENDEIVHFRYGLDPNNTRKGLSPLASVLREIFTDDEAANYSASLVRNIGVPGVVITPGENSTISKESAETIKSSYMEKFTGDKRGEPMILSSKGTVNVISFSPKDMELTSLRRIPEERITAVTGIPAPVVGVGAGLEHMIYNNMTEAKESAYENGIIPMQVLMAAELDVQVIPFIDPKDGRVTQFDTSQVRVLQEDNNALEMRLRNEMLSGAISIAEYRGALGWQVLPEHEVYLRPTSHIEVSTGLNENPPLPALPAPKSISSIDEPEFKGIKTTRVQRSLTRQFRRDSARLTESFSDNLANTFSEVADMVAANMRSIVNQKSLVAHNGRTEYKQSDEWPDEFNDMLDNPILINRVMDTDVVESMLKDTYRDNYENVLTATVNTVNNVAQLNVGLDLDDPQMVAVINNGGIRAGMVDLSSQTREAIYSGLANARDEGLGPIAAIKRIEEYVEGRNLYPGIWDRRYEKEIEKGTSDSLARKYATDASNRYRAETIARTETKHSQNVSAVTTYEKSGVFKNCLVFDGDDCGWTSHDDPDKAHGKVVTFEDARTYTLAHPRCVRDFAPTDEEINSGHNFPMTLDSNFKIDSLNDEFHDLLLQDYAENDPLGYEYFPRSQALLDEKLDDYIFGIKNFTGNMPDPNGVTFNLHARANGVTYKDNRIELNPIEIYEHSNLGPNGFDYVLTHELLHARRINSSNQKLFMNPATMGMEEGLVEGISRKYADAQGWKINATPVYDEFVKTYSLIAKEVGIDEDDLMRNLINKPREEQLNNMIDAINEERSKVGLITIPTGSGKEKMKYVSRMHKYLNAAGFNSEFMYGSLETDAERSIYINRAFFGE